MGTAEVMARSRDRRVRLLAGLVPALLLLAGCESAPPDAAAPPRLDPAPVAAPPVLAVPTGRSPAHLIPVGALQDLLTSGPLGADPAAVVLDAATGEVLLDRDAARPRTPASVLKLATAAAALTVLDPASRLRTRVVRGGAAGDVVLVGAGDTTLSRHPDPTAYPRRAGLRALADATAAAVRGAGTAVSVAVDDSLFTGPAVSPDWPAGYVRSGVVSPVSALSLDGGRVSPRSDAREPDPALAAGRAFAAMLARRGVAVTGEVRRAVAPAGAAELAGVGSPTVAELVELMLASSDNDLAESLLRLVALGRDRPGTFADGTAVVAEALSALGLPTDGLVLLDGSGLARGSAIAPVTLAELLALAAGQGSSPALDHLVSGLPVAGFSGTLSERFGTGREGSAAGVVRAKTGTLTGVSTLAGVTAAGSGALVFVVMADGVPGDTLAARALLDRFAAGLAAGES